jgi:hypothetical protein
LPTTVKRWKREKELGIGDKKSLYPFSFPPERVKKQNFDQKETDSSR